MKKFLLISMLAFVLGSSVVMAKGQTCRHACGNESPVVCHRS
ncbi:MAG TPA: hypothetical protein VHM20_00880 [Gammaproteobacteria bacterium]|jgi:hypothetical protein|nr:hypothetical protein [Gammaproteobacteria bacterium]